MEKEKEKLTLFMGFSLFMFFTGLAVGIMITLLIFNI